MDESADVAVIGGGPVGAAFALALRGSGLDCRVLDAPRVLSAAAGARPVALAHGSRLILERLGVWSAVREKTDILAIQVTQRGGFGHLRLSAAEAYLPALGYVVEYRDLVIAIAAALRPAATRACVERLEVVDGGVAIHYRDEESDARVLRAGIAVIADGGSLNTIAAIRQVDYAQTAITAMVDIEQPHGNLAHECFTPQGPLALLPFGAGYALVWTVAADRVEALCRLPDDGFLEALSAAFGGRLGRFKRVSERAAYPLGMRYATGTLISRAVLIGNAAQTLHPVAGQGFNLGLRDAWELAEILRRVPREQVADDAVLARYRKRRRLDRGGGIAFTHALVRLFSNDNAPLRAARGAGLALLGCLPPVKDFVARRMTFGARG